MHKSFKLSTLSLTLMLSNFSMSIPNYLSPDFIETPPEYLPTIISVVTAEDIEKRGYNTIIEVLQDIPGMKVIYANQNEPHLAYQSGIANNSENIVIAVDESVIQNNQMQRTVVARLPISINEVEKITVWRGAGISAYGFSSAAATINIERKKAVNPMSNQAWIEVGDMDTLNYGFSIGNEFEHVGLYFSISHDSNQGSDGFEIGITNYYRIASAATRMNSRLSYKISDTQSLYSDISYTVSTQDMPFYFVEKEQQERESKAHYMTFGYVFNPNSSTSLDIIYNQGVDEQTWIYDIYGIPAISYLKSLNQIAEINPTLANSLFDNGRYESELTPQEAMLRDRFLADLLSLGENAYHPISLSHDEGSKSTGEMLKTIYTSNIRKKLLFTAELSHYIKKDHQKSWFANTKSHTERMNATRSALSLVYITDTNVSFNLDVSGETNSLVSDFITSGKTSVSYHSPVGAFRLSLGNLYRAPSIAEQKLKYKAKPYNRSELPNVKGVDFTDTFYIRFESPGNFKPQRHIERDVAWIFNHFDHQASIKLFYNTIKHPIVDPHIVYGPSVFMGKDYTLWGLESEFNLFSRSAWSLWGSYSFTQTSAKQFDYLNSMQLKHTGAIGLNIDINEQWSSSISYHGNSETNYGYNYQRADILFTYQPEDDLSFKLLTRYNIDSLGATPSMFEYNIDKYAYGRGLEKDVSIFFKAKYNY